MVYQIVTKTDHVDLTIRELQQSLKFELGEGNNFVHIEKAGQGIYIKKEKNERWIRYEKDHELARAWFLMLRMEEREKYEYEEHCLFEQLQVMLDCSRNAVMKVDTLKEYIRYLAACGYRSLQLYTEDTLKVEKEPYFGYMRGAYTEGEIHEIDEYCKRFGMELIPCIQTLAHINQITRYDQYKPIVDVNDILLAEDDATYEFLEHVIASAARVFSSRKINIGMDEAHMLGLGKYLDTHGYQERFQIMVRHLKRVLEILDRYGFQPMMWSDMFFRLLAQGSYELKEDQVNETLFQMIPKNVELVYWDYYSKDYNHYYNNLMMHHRLSDHIGFAGGAWKWTGFAPENGFSLQTGEQAIKACINSGIKDFMVTCWGDNGGEASAFSVLPCLYQYAEAAYTGCSMTDESQKEARNHNFRILTGLTFDDFMQIDAPNQIFHKTEHCHTNPCKYLLYNDVLLGTFDSLVTKDAVQQYEEKAKQLDLIAKQDTPFAYIFETLHSLCTVLSVKADLGNQLYDAYQKKNRNQLKQIAEVTIPDLLERIKQFQHDFWYQWHRDNKSFGFEVQLIRLGGLKERLAFTQEQILLWLEGGIDEIEELEEKRLPFAYYKESDPSKVNYNLWNTIVSPAVIG